MGFKEHPRYQNADFGDYEFHEYPMATFPGSKDGGKTPDPDPRKPGKFLQECVIVKDDAERRAVLELDAAPEAESTPRGKVNLVDAGGGAKRVETEEDQRAALIEMCETANVQIDKRWGLAKLQDAWDTHQANEPV